MPWQGRKEDHGGEEAQAHTRPSGAQVEEADRLLVEGKDISEVAKHLEISDQTYHRWRNQYGGLKADDAKRLKELAK